MAKYSIWTMQLAKWRLAKERNIKVVDTTAMRGEYAFAPDKSVLFGYKDGIVSEEEYTRLFDIKMERTLESHPLVWKALEEHTEFALTCFCSSGKFCHRHLLLPKVEAYLIGRGHEVQRMGELEKQ